MNVMRLDFRLPELYFKSDANANANAKKEIERKSTKGFDMTAL